MPRCCKRMASLPIPMQISALSWCGGDTDAHHDKAGFSSRVVPRGESCITHNHNGVNCTHDDATSSIRPPQLLPTPSFLPNQPLRDSEQVAFDNRGLSVHRHRPPRCRTIHVPSTTTNSLIKYEHFSSSARSQIDCNRARSSCRGSPHPLADTLTNALPVPIRRRVL